LRKREAAAGACWAFFQAPPFWTCSQKTDGTAYTSGDWSIFARRPLQEEADRASACTGLCGASNHPEVVVLALWHCSASTWWPALPDHPVADSCSGEGISE